jgi:hypothetical protein
VTRTPPSPEQQVRFLRNIQRLLGEGQFVATYKFARIHALADLAVFKGDDSGDALVLDTRDVTTHFIDFSRIANRTRATAAEHWLRFRARGQRSSMRLRLLGPWWRFVTAISTDME